MLLSKRFPDLLNTGADAAAIAPASKTTPAQPSPITVAVACSLGEAIVAVAVAIMITEDHCHGQVCIELTCGDGTPLGTESGPQDRREVSAGTLAEPRAGHHFTQRTSA